MAISPEPSFLNINNIQIAHLVIGEGRPVLMLHGWGASIALLHPLAERLAPMGYRVYMLDLPGFGDSAAPPDAWTVFDYAQFVIAYMDSQKLDQAYLFGHSFGGRLSLILGADYPERVLKMALSNSAGILPKVRPLAQMRLRSYRFIREALNAIGARKLAETLRARYNARYGSADFQQLDGVMRQSFINIVNEDLLPFALRVKASTILIWGDQDEDTPLWQGQRLEQSIPDAGLIIHEGAGHYSYLDRLPETARIMDYFFSQP